MKIRLYYPNIFNQNSYTTKQIIKYDNRLNLNEEVQNKNIFNKASINKQIQLSAEQSHYITKVMRQTLGDKIYIFNKEEGEFLCTISEISKNACICINTKQTRTFTTSNTETICVFAIIKPKQIEEIIEKCTQIGVQSFLPMVTSRTNISDIKTERLQKIAIEASEQCGRIDIPTICKPVNIQNLQQHLNGFQAVLLHQNGVSFNKTNHSNKNAIITGPEGGLTEEEVQFLETFAIKVKISENILRAETASILGCGLVMTKQEL